MPVVLPVLSSRLQAHKDDCAGRVADVAEFAGAVDAHNQPGAFRRHFVECFTVADDGQYGGNGVPAALFARGDDDFLPACEAFGGAFSVEADDAAFADDGLYGGYAEFDAFLQGEIHAIAGGNGLDERDVERGLVVGCVFVQDFGFGAVFFQNGQPCGMCLAFAVEEGDVFVGADAQDVEVADDVVGQGDGLSDGKVFGQVESGHSFWRFGRL